MNAADVIIVGGGPAGASCAGFLRAKGIDVLLLDKQEFPRPKPCAGWITPRVLKTLGLAPAVYPHSLTAFDRFIIHYRGHAVRLPVRQYAIRRIEFDDWLLKRAGVPIVFHKVETIIRRDGFYYLDDVYQCKYLVGAGGTSCPVYRTFFSERHPRAQERQIAALEVEYRAVPRDPHCHLWFSENGLPGYAWYVPKANGYLNVGIGGKAREMRGSVRSLQQHWEKLVDALMTSSLIDSPPPSPTGYSYYLRDKADRIQLDDLFIVGDAAGLATRDMGEGIGPAVESGIRAAEAIITGRPYSVASIRAYSLWDILFAR